MKEQLCFLFILVNVSLFAQNRNSVWIFGDSAGIDFSNVANPVPISSGMDGRGSCTSISDSLGKLIFYSFTRANTSDWAAYVYNIQNVQLQFGDSITGAAWYNELQILPNSNNLNMFYLFSCGMDVPNNEGLYYSQIDMSLNGGLGVVTLKNVKVNSNRIADCLSSVKHGNGKDWWIISKLSDASPSYYNRFFKYLIVGDSVLSYSYQDFNDARDADFQKLIWNSAFDKFMLINTGGFMSEYSFDRCNGNISLIRNIFSQQSSNYSRLFWDGAYAPSGNIFYVSTNYWLNVDTAYLLQLNLNAADIPASADTIGSFQGYVGTGAVRLAPDNKIYFSRACQWGFPGYPYPDSVRNYINENLSVINSPDSLGAACNYQPFSFYLGGKRTYYGLPNNPNYDLGPLVGSLCDTLTVGIFNNEQGISNAELAIFYHPSWQTAFINAQHLKGKQAVLSVYNLQGQVIHKTTGDCYKGYFTYDLVMKGLANGMYIVNLQTEKESLVRKFVKQ